MASRILSFKASCWIFHHDNAPAHSSMLVREFWAKNSTVIMSQYSTDLASDDFFVFPKLKIAIKAKRFATIEDKKFYLFFDHTSYIPTYVCKLISIMLEIFRQFLLLTF